MRASSSRMFQRVAPVQPSAPSVTATMIVCRYRSSVDVRLDVLSRPFNRSPVVQTSAISRQDVPLWKYGLLL